MASTTSPTNAGFEPDNRATSTSTQGTIILDDNVTPSGNAASPTAIPSTPAATATTSGGATAAGATAFREISVLRPEEHKYTGNTIKTTRYSIVPFFLDFFLWKMLYEQFQRQANIYFAVISALQLVPGLSPTGTYTTLLTLCVVLTFSMCKSGFEDYKRYRKDSEVNNRIAYVLRDPAASNAASHDGATAKSSSKRGERRKSVDAASTGAGSGASHVWVAVPYTDVRVGDIVRVLNVANKSGARQNDIPCDIALLSTSEGDGTAYVETANLDGETNLKARRCLEITRVDIADLVTGPSLAMSLSTAFGNGINTSNELGAASGVFESGAGGGGASGSRQLTTSLSAGDSGAVGGASTRSHPVRASVEAGRIALQRYAGMRLETEQPNGSLYTFSGNIVMPDGTRATLSPDQMMYRGCMLRKVHWIIGVVVFTGPETKVMQNAKKPPHKSSRVELMVNKLLIAILLLQLSMCVLCTIGLALTDNTMWYLREDDTSTAMRAGLGFLTFVILFNNLIPISLYVSLEMIKFIQGRMMEQDLCMYYAPKDMTANAKSTDLNEELGQINYVFSDKTGTLTRNVMTFMKFCINGRVFGTGTTEIGRAAAKRQGRDLHDERPEEVQNSAFPFWDPRVSKGKWVSLPEAEEIRRLFLLLASCHTVVIDSGKYEAESPDEEALVKAANEFGYRFVGRNSESTKLHIGAAGIEERHRVLEVIEFNSDRKRMSNVVMLPDGTVKLYMKGADNVIMARLRPDTPALKETQQCLAQFGDEGLRTLMLSERTLPESEWQPWLERCRAARAIIGDNKRRAALLDELAAEIERDMTLVGCTAIEDKLQEGVPSAIESLRLAGLKVWMLTGDKVETAINIAFACALLHNNMHMVQMVELTEDAVIVAAMNDLAAGGGDLDKSLVIDGATLALILSREDLSDRLYEVTNGCTSVVCSRVSPKQKADVVEMVRYRAGSSVTLAIGDGANDVPMIQAAHVGVGISGMEGQQAANAADYAIGQFKYLHRLVMVHGRVNYYRLTHVINYFFYKNIVLIMTQFWYCFFNGFTGQSLYEKWSLALYNVFWTSLPVIIFGIFDRDVLNTDNVHLFPKIYEPGLKLEMLNVRVFLQWVATAVAHSLICFFVVMFGWGAMIGDDGASLSLDGAGVTLYTCVIFVANTKLALHIQSFTWLHHLTVWGSIAVWFLFLAVYGVFPVSFSTTMYWILQNVGFQPAPWLFFFLCVVLTLSRDFVWKYGMHRFAPLSFMPLRLKLQYKDAQDPLAATRAPLEVRKRDGYTRRDVVGGVELGNLFADYEADRIVINPAQDFMLQFVDTELEDEFVSVHIGTMFRYKVGLGLCSIAAGLLVISFIVQRDDVNHIEIYMWALFAAASWVCFFLVLLVDVKRNLHPIMLLLILIGFSGMTIANLLASQRNPETHPVAMAVILLGLLTVVRPPLLHAIQYVIIAFVCYLCWYQGFRVEQWEQLDFAVRFVEVAIVALTALVSLASSEKFMRRMFISQKQVKASCDRAAQEEARSLRLLANVLPSAIVKEVRVNKRQLSEFSVVYKEASMLNSDIVKFTQFSSTKEPHVVVEMLNRMFTKFDAHSATLGIEKIKTIGDAYVAAAGIPIPDTFHMHKIIAMGLRMLDSIAELNAEGLSTLRVLDIQIRIGCATGPVKTGVVGMQKVCYEVFGETPRQSEHMEQSGRPNRVHVTPKLRECLEQAERQRVQGGAEIAVPLTFEVIDGEHFVVTGDKSVPIDDEQNRLYVPVADVHREDIYQFLKDSDADRREIIKLWAGFEGKQAGASLNFEELEAAELDFRAYLRHLAHARFATEMAQVTLLFVLCAVLVGLYLKKYTHAIVLVLAAAAVVHFATFVAVAVAKWLANRNQTHVLGVDDDDSDTNSNADAEGAEIDRRLTRAQSVARRISKPEDQPQQSGATAADDSASHDLQHQQAQYSSPVTPSSSSQSTEETSLCTLARAILTLSSLAAFAAPLLVLLAIDSSGKLPGLSTIAVFVVLAVIIFVLNTFHLRITHKYGVAILSFIVVSGAYFYASASQRSFSAANDGGDYFAIVLCYALSLISSYNTEANVRRSFAAAKNVVYQNAEVQSATALCDKLLNNVLPAPIVVRMKNSMGEQIVDEVAEASVCFLYTEGLLDAVDDAAEADGSAALLIEHINKFLVLLDTLTVRHGVEKIKTSPFLVVSGCPEPCATHAEQLVTFARDVMHSVARFNAETGASIKVKAGVHSGKVTAGVLGSTKFLYDVFGDSVNLASRLTSDSTWGTVQLSATTNALVSTHFATKHKGFVELKGKGKQDVFMLVDGGDGVVLGPDGAPLAVHSSASFSNAATAATGPGGARAVTPAAEPTLLPGAVGPHNNESICMDDL